MTTAPDLKGLPVDELASGLGVGLVQRRALIALPFALAAVTVVFSTKGPVLFTLSPGPWRLQATEPGVHSYRIRVGDLLEEAGRIVHADWKVVFFPWTVDPREASST